MQIESMLKACPGATPVFVSATISSETASAIRDICRAAGRASAQRVKVHQTQRSTFQADFSLHASESKVCACVCACVRHGVGVR